MGAKVIIWLVGGSETIPRPIPNLPLKPNAPKDHPL